MVVAKLFSRTVLFLPFFFITFALSAGAEEKKELETPLYLPGGKVVSPVLAKKLHESKEAKFYDTRSSVEFNQARIAGARLLSYLENSERAAYFDSSLDQFDTIQLPPNKGQTMVFYCGGPNGWKSYKAAVLAIKEGYRDVMWLREGFSGWQAAQYPIE